MRYLLSEEEYQELIDAPREVRAEFEGVLQTLCTRIADTEIITTPGHWMEGKPWGCVITVENKPDSLEYGYEWYCDGCPVDIFCPYEYKRYSK